MAPQPSTETCKSSSFLEKDQESAKKEIEISSSSGSPGSASRIHAYRDCLSEISSQHEVSMDMQVVRNIDVNDPSSMQLLPDGLETSDVEAEEIQVEAQTEPQSANESQPIQEVRNERKPLGCLFAYAEGIRKPSNGKHQGREWFQCFERAKKGDKRQGSRDRFLDSKCCNEGTAQNLHPQLERSGSYHQDGHRIPHQKRQGCGRRRSPTCASEQGGCIEEGHWEATAAGQECRSGMAQVQSHYEEEIPRAEGWLQGSTENLDRCPLKESTRVPGRCSRTQEEGQCRTEPHGARAAGRGNLGQAFAGRRTMGDRRFRRRDRRDGVGREAIQEPSSGALQEIQAEESKLKVEQSSDRIDAAPGPLFEAAADPEQTKEDFVTRIGASSPHHMAFCLKVMCISCSVFEIVQHMWYNSLLRAGLTVGVCLCLCLFSLWSKKAKRSRCLCCVRSRRHVRRIFERKEKPSALRRAILYLLVWQEIGFTVQAVHMPASSEVGERYSRFFTQTWSWQSLDSDGQNFGESEYTKSMSASWTSSNDHVNLMAAQRPIWGQRDEQRQAAFERNEVIGEEDILREVTALNQHDRLNGFCIMSHAVKLKHEGSRELWINLQHGDDFLDLVFAVRQRWSDIILPFQSATLIYVSPQPPPSTTGGNDCLHLILDGLPFSGGRRNLVAVSFEFSDGSQSDVWFQAQRNQDVLSRGILLHNLNLASTCMSVAVSCTCRAGLTVFEGDVQYQNQDGICATVQIDLQDFENDFSSLMARRFDLNRLVSYIYRLGTDEPIFVQLSGIPESQRLNFVREKLSSRPSQEERGESEFHPLQEVPEIYRNRDVWILIQEFTNTKKENHAIIMLDVEIFEQAIMPRARPSDEWREVTYVRKEASRDILLQDAELSIFCKRGEGNCRVEKNGVLWPESDGDTHELANGCYIKVAVQSQREDLPFCVQWEQAQRGIQVQDMVDTRRHRKRSREPDGLSSESSDSTALLQVDKSLRRHFSREKRERLPPPGNGVGFESEITVLQGGTEKRVQDRSAKNSFIADFCETRTEEPLPSLFLDFVKKVRFKEIDESSSEADSDNGGGPQGISLEHLLPIQSDDNDTIEGILAGLRNDPEARYPIRQDWESIGGLNPIVQNVLDAQQSFLTGSVIKMHISLMGRHSTRMDKKRQHGAWWLDLSMTTARRQTANSLASLGHHWHRLLLVLTI